MRTPLSAAEVRATALAYYQIREMLTQPLPDETRDQFDAYLKWADQQCFATTDTSAPARWARGEVGSVLGAAVGAAAWMGGDRFPNQTAALRIFGLAGEHPLSAPAAWALLRPYTHEPVLSERALSEIRKATGLRLRFSAEPTPLDALEELTRPRGGGFPIQVAQWLADYFRDHADDQTGYAAAYRKALADLMALNATGEMATLAWSSAGVAGKLSRADWDAILHGRIPESRLQTRAGYAVARQFVAEYWDRWQAKRTKSAR